MKNKIIDIVHEIILEPVADALRNGGEKLTGTENVKTVLEKTKKFVQKSGVNPADATVTAGDILAGETAYGSDGKKLTGTIASKAAQTYTPGTVDQTISAGQYLAGAQTIKGDANLTAGNIIKGKSIFGVAGSYTDVDTSDATATENQIRKGKTAYNSAGVKITGNIPDKGDETYTPGTADQTIAAGQYLTGLQVIKGDRNLTAGNIIKGKSIFGIAGTLPGASTYYQCTAVSGDTWSGKKLVFDNSGKGTISDTVKSGLLCSGFTPEVGGIYLEDSTIKVKYFTWGLMPTDGLVFYAPFSSASDMAETGQAITTVGTVPYSVIKGIPCANFENRSVGYLNAETTNLPYDNAERTISVWFYINSGAEHDSGTTLFSYGDADSYGSGRWYTVNAIPKHGFPLGFYSYDATVMCDFEFDTWYHLCLTKEQGSADTLFYLNGHYIGTHNKGYSQAPNVLEILRFGTCCFDDGKRTAGLNGNLAGFRAYNKVLSQDEITILSKEFTPIA